MKTTMPPEPLTIVPTLQNRWHRGAKPFALAASPTAYDPPADINDFASNPALAAKLKALWNNFMVGATQIAIVGDPWTVQNDNNRSWYFNLNDTVVPPGTTPAAITWTAFPNRLNEYFGTVDTGNPNPFQLSAVQLAELADTGKVAGVPAFANGFPNVPTEICPKINWKQSTSDWQPFGPGGPRGWQDEYCEWAVTRNANGKITSVSFTCENPEYWFSMWRIDPNTVLGLYQQYVNPAVQLADLQLTDPKTKKPVIDSLTGQAAYNPLNKWNTGTTVGAMHLTSPPNTVGAEIYLGAAATLLRSTAAEANASALVCCAQYGQPYRNSDPHIGFSVNQLVYSSGLMGTLANPVGLYIQSPDFSGYQLPSNAPAGKTAADYWQIKRGRTGSQAGTPYDQILRVVFSVPASDGFTVSDIQINGAPIRWASQITQTFQVGLGALPLATSQPAQKQQSCPIPQPANQTNPWPQLLIDATVLNAYVNTIGLPPTPPPTLKRGQNYPQLALVCVSGDKAATVSFPNGGITATVTGVVPLSGITHGTTQTYDMVAYILDISVSATAPVGPNAVLVVNPGMVAGPPSPSILFVE